MSRALSLLIALSAFGLSAVITLHHPIAPGWGTAGAVLWAGIVVARPAVWLTMVPACVPWLDFSPWTGWTQQNEFDVLLLATLAGAHMRRALEPIPTRWPAPRASAIVAVLLATGLVRGLLDAPRIDVAWFDDAFSALNSVRATKSLVCLLLWAPLMRRELDRGGERALHRLFVGVLVGLAIAVLAAAWERATYPGLLETSSPYRSTALFWEMHVGGAAIDAYLAFALPFIVWVLLATRRDFVWLCAAGLALAATYVALTTFSRGLVLSALVWIPMLAVLLLERGAGSDTSRRGGRITPARVFALAVAVLLAVTLLVRLAGVLPVLALTGAGSVAWWWTRRRTLAAGWRAPAGAALVVVLLAEILSVIGPHSFMADRLARGADDYGSRWEHWMRGIELMHGPTPWLLGIGAGRLPAHYASFTREGPPSGSIAWRPAADGGWVRITGPYRAPVHSGTYALTQRVVAEDAYGIAFDVASTQGAVLHARVCEAHLLYDRACQAAVLRVAPMRSGEVRRLERSLRGPPLQRPAMLMLSVADTGGAAEVDNVVLSGPSSPQLLANPGFDADLAHWLPVARHHFLPWHIDNLYLELLIERGLVGLLAFTAIVVVALHRVLLGAARRAPEAPFLAASLCAVLTVGAVSSVLDVPRVAFLFGLFLLAALVLRPAAARRRPPGSDRPSPAG